MHTYPNIIPNYVKPLFLWKRLIAAALTKKRAPAFMRGAKDLVNYFLPIIRFRLFFFCIYFNLQFCFTIQQ